MSTQRNGLRTRGMAWALTFALGSAFSARAGAEDVAVDSFMPAPDQMGFTGFPSTRTPGAWGFDGTLWLDYSLHTLEGAAVGGGAPDIIDHRVSGTLSAQLGLFSRAALALRLPVLFYQDVTDGASDGNADLESAAVGNPAFDARVRVYGAPVRPDGSVEDGAALALRAIVMLPVNTTGTLFTEDAFRAEFQAIADVETFGIGAGLALGYRYRPDDGNVFGTKLDDQLHLVTGVRVPFPLLARKYPGRVQESTLVELDVATDPKNFFDKSTTPMEARVSYRMAVSDLFGTLSVGAGLLPAIGSPDLRVLLGVGWSPRRHDQDADGVPDSDDFCVHLPEDRDGFQDEDGCADDDNDGDLIVDEDDLCPLEPAEVGKDDDEDGCTDK